MQLLTSLVVMVGRNPLHLLYGGVAGDESASIGNTPVRFVAAYLL